MDPSTKTHRGSRNQRLSEIVKSGIWNQEFRNFPTGEFLTDHKDPDRSQFESFPRHE